MPADVHFINRGLLLVRINDFLRQELARAGYSGVELHKTPLGTRVIIYAARPGMVIGRRGVTVRQLTEDLEVLFNLEAPQIEVSEIEVPEHNGAVMAERLAQRLERGDHFRRASYGVLRRIMHTGVTGCEITIKGKLTSRRSRYQKFRSGFVAKTGEPVRTNVSHGIATAVMKQGVIGIQVRIMKPGAVSPDKPIIQHREPEIPPTPIITEAEATEEAPIEEASSIEEYTEITEETTEVEETPTEKITEEVTPSEEVVTEEPPAEEKPKRKRRTRKKAEEEKPPEEEKPKRKRRTRKTKSESAEKPE